MLIYPFHQEFMIAIISSCFHGNMYMIYAENVLLIGFFYYNIDSPFFNSYRKTILKLFTEF